MIVPINDIVLVESVKEQRTLAGGFVAEDNEKDRYLKAKVIKASEKVPLIKDGDIVWFDSCAGHEHDFGCGIYTVIKERDIISIEKND